MLPMDKHSNLLRTFVNYDRKKYYNTGANVIKLFLSIIYGFLKYARVFVPGKLLQPSLMFAGKAGAYLSEAPFRCSTLG